MSKYQEMDLDSDDDDEDHDINGDDNDIWRNS